MLHFKDLYKNVKTERNKYVNLIQNLNHDKAERKQKIKTLENELDILKKNVNDKGRLTRKKFGFDSKCNSSEHLPKK